MPNPAALVIIAAGAGLLLLTLKPNGDPPPPPPPPAPILDLGADMTAQLEIDGIIDIIVNYTVQNIVIATRMWEQLAGPPGGLQFTDTGPLQGRITATMPGEYVVQLTVIASDGVTQAVDTVNITVRPPPPTLNLGPDQTTQLNAQGEAILLLDYQLSDQGVKVWSSTPNTGVSVMDTGPTQASIKFTVADSYQVMLTVTVPGSLPVSDTIGVTVTPAPVIPTVNLGADITRQFTGGTGTIQHTYTWTPAGSVIASRDWTVLQGNPDNLHIFDPMDGIPGRVDFHVHAPGVYEMQLAIVLNGVVGTATDKIVLTVTSAPVGDGLRNIPAPLLIGCATHNDFWTLPDTTIYSATAAKEFNLLTPANQMKFSRVHPAPTTYDFTKADQHVQFAQANNMKVLGNVLIWHNSLPDWVTTGVWTKATLTNVLNGHIDTVVGHFRNNVVIWDVVTEALAGNGTFSPTIWYKTIGKEYIELAFRRARAADPNAQLMYSDFDCDVVNNKSNAMYNMAVDFKNRGVPIDAVGLFAQISTNGINYGALATNMARFAALGLDVNIYGMVVPILSGHTLEMQAEVYRQVMRRCLAQPRCKVFLTWGFTDKYGFLSTLRPRIFDANYNRKPAWFALRDELLAN